MSRTDTRTDAGNETASERLPSGTIVPCLWLDDQAERAARFYSETFPRGRITSLSHYPQTGNNPSGKAAGSVLTVEFEIAGQHFTALNGGPHFEINPSISFFVYVDTPREADALFARLAEGGKVLMGIDKYPWSERYGWVQDRFGASWQVISGVRPGAATISPCLMFAGKRQGQAEAALKAYAAAFPGSRIDAVERYAAGEGPEGNVKHGRASLGGQPLIAMDSHAPHAFDFDPGLSLQVMCADQAEVDRYWGTLSEGGAPGQCGWLTDRFGVSWQVVPNRIAEWLTSKDIAARDRAFQAVMGMRKIDIAAIEAAFRG